MWSVSELGWTQFDPSRCPVLPAFSRPRLGSGRAPDVLLTYSGRTRVVLWACSGPGRVGGRIGSALLGRLGVRRSVGLPLRRRRRPGWLLELNLPAATAAGDRAPTAAAPAPATDPPVCHPPRPSSTGCHINTDQKGATVHMS